MVKNYEEKIYVMLTYKGKILEDIFMSFHLKLMRLYFYANKTREIFIYFNKQRIKFNKKLMKCSMIS